MCGVRRGSDLSAARDSLSGVRGFLGAWQSGPSRTHTRSIRGWSRRQGWRPEGTRVLAGARQATAAPRAAPPLWGLGLAGRRRPSPAQLTHLRVQRHQLHERPGLLELGERHRAAAGPPVLHRRPEPRRLLGSEVPRSASPASPSSPPRPSCSGWAVRRRRRRRRGTSTSAPSVTRRRRAHWLPARGGGASVAPPRPPRRGIPREDPRLRHAGSEGPASTVSPRPTLRSAQERPSWLLPPKPGPRGPNLIRAPGLPTLSSFGIASQMPPLSPAGLYPLIPFTSPISPQPPPPPRPTPSHTECPRPDPGRSWKRKGA